MADVAILKILVDQMYQNIYLRLKERGYDAYSVDLLIVEGKPMKSDYSILKYAEQNKMVIITRDGQNRIACKENNIACISLGENPDIDAVIAEIEKLMTGDTSIQDA